MAKRGNPVRTIPLTAFAGILIFLVAPFALPAVGQGVQKSVDTCIRSDLHPGDCGPGRLEVDFKARMAPRRLPSREFAPVAVIASGVIGTEAGEHPSALRRVTLSIGRGARVDTSGLATCKRRWLERLAVAEARNACRRAIVGHGMARIGFASSGAVVRAPLTLFNGGTSAGMTRLYVHGAAGALGGPLVAVAQVRRHGKGLEATWTLPRILDGDGSLLGFRFEIKRTFARSGGLRSYLYGSCPDEGLRARFSKLTFVNEAHAPGVAPRTMLRGGLAVPCGPKRR